MLDILTEAPCPALPKPVHVARAANRLRQKLRPELRTGRGMSSFQFLPSRLDSEAETASDLRQTRAVEYADTRKSMVRGWNVQACSSPFQAAPDSKCFHQIRGICKASAACIRLDGQ